MRPRFVVLNIILFVLAFLVSKALIYFFPLESMEKVTALFIHGLIVFGLSLGLLYLIFGNKVLLSDKSVRKETMLDEARFIVLTAGIVQVSFPLLPGDEEFLYLEFAIGALLLFAYFLKQYWITFAALLIYSVYILADNFQLRGPIISVPFVVALLYEFLFLYKMARLNLQKAGRLPET